MANEIAIRDPNRVPALLAHDSTGKETRKVKLTASGAIPVGNTDSVSVANTPSIASAATAIASNAARKAWQIQNVGINPLFVLLGNGASTSVFHAVLKGGTGASDGLGGSISQTSGAIYTGIITVAGTSPSYVVMEL